MEAESLRRQAEGGAPSWRRLVEQVGRSRRRYWTAFRRFWHQYQWPVLAATAIVGLVLGFFGWMEQDETLSVPDILYLDLQLWIAIGSPKPTNAALDIARFLLPAVTGYSALRAGTLLLRRRMVATRAGFAKDHVIVAGCGQTGLGFALSARREGRVVTVIDRDPNNTLLDLCHEAGVHVVIGDATDADTLAQARLDRAADLVALCPSDDDNHTIATQAMLGAKSRGRARRLRIAARIRDPRTAQSLRAFQIKNNPEGVVLEVFDAEQAAAPLLLDRLSAAATGGTLVLVGDNPLFAHLLRELTNRETARANRHAPDFTSVLLVADPAPAWLAGVRATWGTHPELVHLGVPLGSWRSTRPTT